MSAVAAKFKGTTHQEYQWLRKRLGFDSSRGLVPGVWNG